MIIIHIPVEKIEDNRNIKKQASCGQYAGVLDRWCCPQEARAGGRGVLSEMEEEDEPRQSRRRLKGSSQQDVKGQMWGQWGCESDVGEGSPVSGLAM